MYALPILSIRMIFHARISLECVPVCALCSCSDRQCHVMLDLRLSMHALQQPASLLFSRRPTGRTIFTGLTLINDSKGTTRMKVQWLPTPYPNGITQALLISRSPETHIPSIGLDTRKKVAWACACVLNNGLSQVKPIPIPELFSQRPVGNVLVVIHE